MLTHALTCMHIHTVNHKYFKLNYNNFKVYTTKKSQIIDKILSFGNILLLMDFINKFNPSLITQKFINKKIYYQIVRQNNKWINVRI